MKILRSIFLLLALAGLTSAGTLFSGITAAQNTSACAQQFSAGDQQVSLYASGPASGTWTATVRFFKLRGDGGLALVATTNLSNAGPNIDGTGTRIYDAIDLNEVGGTTIYADVTNVTGTVPAGIALYAETK
jgi:hypothetical protein